MSNRHGRLSNDVPRRNGVPTTPLFNLSRRELEAVRCALTGRPTTERCRVIWTIKE